MSHCLRGHVSRFCSDNMKAGQGENATLEDLIRRPAFNMSIMALEWPSPSLRQSAQCRPLMLQISRSCQTGQVSILSVLNLEPSHWRISRLARRIQSMGDGRDQTRRLCQRARPFQKDIPIHSKAGASSLQPQMIELMKALGERAAESRLGLVAGTCQLSLRSRKENHV